MSLRVRVIERVVGFVPRRLTLGIYGFPRLAGILRGFLNAVVPAGFQEVSVVAGPLRGTRFLLDLKTEKYYWLGTSEPWVQEAIQKYLRPGQVAWDVGAFIGYYTLLMYRICGPGRVVALEPNPANRARLEKNLALNGARDVFVIPAAAGQVAGKAWFEGHGSCMRMAPSGDIACDVVRLDDLLERFPPPRLVKMDIEGGEDDALAGASRLLSEVRPVWVVELLDRLVRRPVSGSGRRAIDSCGLVRTSTFQRTSLSVVRPISWPPRKGQRVKGSVCGTIGNCGPIDEQQGG